MFSYPYKIYKTIIKGGTHYHVSFLDADGSMQDVEVHRKVYLEFIRSKRRENSQRRWDERYLSAVKFTDNILGNIQPKTPEDAYIGKEKYILLQEVLSELTVKQRRRFILYYGFKFTLEEIAEREGCSKRAIKFSIDGAKEKVVNNL